MNILLLTSTIRPKADQPDLAIVDVDERLADYARSLAFQTRLLEQGVIDRIVYVDNSGFDLAPLRDRFPSPSIEWVSHYGLDYDPSFHRGYGEFRLIDHAFSVSRTLGEMSADAKVWKLTGRYIASNLGRVIRMTPRWFDVCCNVRGGWAELSLVAWSAAGYERHIRGLWEHFATPTAPELVLAERLFADGDPNAILSWFWPPYIEGRRGANRVPFAGRWTPVRFAITAGVKAAQWPFRRAWPRSVAPTAR